MTARKSHHSAGWYAGALLFWLLSAWLITVGLSSIIPQIFWPAGDVQAEGGSCHEALRELRAELLQVVSNSIGHAPSGQDAAEGDPSLAGGGRDALLAWFDNWDQRLFRARPSCRDSERAAWTELGRLRHGMQALIERFEREEAPRIQRLDELLGQDEQARAHIPRKTIQHE